MLRPGGALRFFEHVRAQDPRLARWQDRLQRPWGWLTGGCHPNRDRVMAITTAGLRVRRAAAVLRHDLALGAPGGSQVLTAALLH